MKQKEQSNPKKDIGNIEHEEYSPKHVLAASPRQGAMTPLQKLKCQTTRKKTKKNSKLPKEVARSEKRKRKHLGLAFSPKLLGMLLKTHEGLARQN